MWERQITCNGNWNIPRREKEWDTGLACHSPCQHGLASSGFTSKQHTLRKLSTELAELCWVLQKSNHVFELFFCLVHTVYVAEANGFAGLMGFEFGLTRSSLDEPGVLDHDGEYSKDDYIWSE